MTYEKISRGLLHAAAGFLVAFALVDSLTGCSMVEAGVDAARGTTSPATDTDSIETSVVRIVDGDTLVVRAVPDALEATNDAGTQHTVRVLGIDAPEMNFYKDVDPECGAEAATEKLRTLLPKGATVFLSYDPRSDHTDRYGRSLAYVSDKDGNDVGLTQISNGLAEVWYPKGEPAPAKTVLYRDTQNTAQKNNLGSWDKCSTLGR